MSPPRPARRTPFADSRSRFLAGKQGMGLFLVSLGILFASTLVGFLVLRLRIGRAWPDLPALPAVLWLSTLAIIVSSATMQWGLESIRRNRLAHLRIAMLATLALGLTFLGLHSIAWLQWLPQAAQRWDQSEEWRFALTCFYLFTIVHALHVSGGLIPLSVVTWRSMRPMASASSAGGDKRSACTAGGAGAGYSADNHAGVQLCAMYWHFLDAVWLVLLATMMIGV